MNDLDLRVEHVEVPADGAVRARRVGTSRVRRRWLGASALGAAIVVLAVALALPGRDQAERVSTDPATTVPTGPVLGAPLLDLPRAALDAQPAIPDGWKPVDHGLARIWVPAAWELMSAERFDGCPLVRGPVVVIGQRSGNCGASERVVNISLGLQYQGTETVNGLRFDQLGGLRCADCSRYVGFGQLSITLGGNVPELDQIIATIGPSPVARVLADGPLVSTDGWRPVVTDLPASTTGTTVPGPTGPLALWVPSDWPTRTLGERDTVPGSCLAPRLQGPATVLLGPGGQVPSCPFSPSPVRATAGADGVWLPGTNDVRSVAAVPPASSVGTFQVGPDQDAVELNVFTANGSVRVLVGIGSDPAVARTILRTLSFG